MERQDRLGDFTFVDLFAGIGGFAAALIGLGGRCVGSVEIDEQAAAVYRQNFGVDPLGDITQIAPTQENVALPDHEVLTAGFPCQPFSKSGAQRGMDEARGTLFWNILNVIHARRPAVVILENVRNLAGPRHRHEWDIIIRDLRRAGYHVSSTPAVFSPHLLPREEGGAPQIRERVFITATYWPERKDENPEPAVKNKMIRGDAWNLLEELELDASGPSSQTRISADERLWLQAWEDFRQHIVEEMRRRSRARDLDEVRLPGFPIWVDAWVHERDLVIPTGTPRWKENFLRKNSAFYSDFKEILDWWVNYWGVGEFPASRRKFEWQAQHANSVWDCAIQLRPSGIRVKRMTHLPALVAMAQIPILGPLGRRLTVREAARLQGLPEWFVFGDQSDAASYKQLGNGVNVGVVQHVLRRHVERDLVRVAEIAPGLLPLARSADASCVEELVAAQG